MLDTVRAVWYTSRILRHGSGMSSLADRRRVLQMKYLGYSDEVISHQLALSPQTVSELLALAAAAETDSIRASAVREAELTKLDELDEVYLPMALEGSMKAARFVLDIMRRRAALAGIDRQQPVVAQFNLVHILANMASPPRRVSQVIDA